jgi:HEPN domain-containing protein
MKILSKAITDPIFMDKYHKSKTPNMLFDPIISVMAKHIYETSNIFEIVSIANNFDSSEKNQLFLSEELESEISKEGVKIIEKLVDQAEFLKLIKTLKEIVGNFTPAKALPQNIEQLENNLLLTFCILKVKNFFNTDLKGIVDALKNILKKEVGFIEAYKKEKSGKSQADEEESIKDNIKSSCKRMLLQIGIIKLIFNSCIKSYNEARSFITAENANESNPNFINCAKYFETVKEIIKIYLEFFDKSNDTDNITNILDNLVKNISFVLKNENEIDNNILEMKKNNNDAINVNRYLKDANSSNNNAKNDASILVLFTNNLINLLRKNVDYDKISDIICSIFLSFCKKKLEICDVLVKLGCPRLLLSIIEITNNSGLATKALELLKTLMTSTDENLNMISNQSNFFSFNFHIVLY